MTNKLTFVEKFLREEVRDKLKKKYNGRKSILNKDYYGRVYTKVRTELSVDFNEPWSAVPRIIIRYSDLIEDLAIAEARVKSIKLDPLYRAEDWE